MRDLRCAAAPDHEPLIKLCTRPLKNVGAYASPAAAMGITGGLLRSLLDKQDAILGPWVQVSRRWFLTSAPTVEISSCCCRLWWL